MLQINSLSRWEIIDVIRTLSTQAAKARSDFSGIYIEFCNIANLVRVSMRLFTCFFIYLFFFSRS